MYYLPLLWLINRDLINANLNDVKPFFLNVTRGRSVSRCECSAQSRLIVKGEKNCVSKCCVLTTINSDLGDWLHSRATSIYYEILRARVSGKFLFSADQNTKT